MTTLHTAAAANLAGHRGAPPPEEKRSCNHHESAPCATFIFSAQPRARSRNLAPPSSPHLRSRTAPATSLRRSTTATATPSSSRVLHLCEHTAFAPPSAQLHATSMNTIAHHHGSSAAHTNNLREASPQLRRASDNHHCTCNASRVLPSSRNTTASSPEQPHVGAAAVTREGEKCESETLISGERICTATCQRLIGQSNWSTGQLWSTGQSQ